jgi:hypothetical protein
MKNSFTSLKSNRQIYILIAAVFVAMELVLALSFTRSVSAIQAETEKVTICHRTNSVSNPYVTLSVPTTAIDGLDKSDHNHHSGPVATSEAAAQALKDNKVKWGDIIPNVLNWDQAGQAVYNNNCGNGEAGPTEVVPSVTFKAPTCTTLGSYTIPETEGVSYKINDEVVAAGTYSAQNGTTVTIEAAADEDHFIADETVDTWTNTFTAPECGEVLGAQVTDKPVGGVNAGGGSSSIIASVFGLVTSLGLLSYGAVSLLRRN